MRRTCAITIVVTVLKTVSLFSTDNYFQTRHGRYWGVSSYLGNGKPSQNTLYFGSSCSHLKNELSDSPPPPPLFLLVKKVIRKPRCPYYWAFTLLRFNTYNYFAHFTPKSDTYRLFLFCLTPSGRFYSSAGTDQESMGQKWCGNNLNEIEGTQGFLPQWPLWSLLPEVILKTKAIAASGSSTLKFCQHILYKQC